MLTCNIEVVGDIVHLSGTKYGETYAKIRCPDGVGTWERLSKGYDADNYWIGVKPSDDWVFNKGLFNPRKKLILKSIDWELK